MGRRGRGTRSGGAAAVEDQQQQQQQQERVEAADTAEGGSKSHGRESSPAGSPPTNDCSHGYSSSGPHSSGPHSSGAHTPEAPTEAHPGWSSRSQQQQQLQQQQQRRGEEGHQISGCCGRVDLQQQQQQQQQQQPQQHQDDAIAILVPRSPAASAANAAAGAAPAAAGAAAATGVESDALRRQQALDAAAARARGKLVMASGVCLVFMAIEVVAGIAANSLALMTDASHLLSDLCAFLISLFALWVSQLRGTLSMSFGYHRAEILGALLSVLLIWGVTAALVVAALDRIASPVPVQGGLMFLTASIGTAANVFMAHILHIHSHGIGLVHTESHKHHSNSSSSSSSSAVSPQHNSRHGGPCCSSSKKYAHVHSKREGGNGNEGQETELLLLQQDGNEAAAQQQQQQQQLQPAAAAAASGTDVYVQLEEDPETEIESMNLRAAYIHAVGDLLQNIGVMIASAIIWFKPEYSVADPICTLLFSVFVLLTTLSIIREAVNVLMEGTPLGLDVAELQADLVSLRGVLEVHDLHVWSISVGRPALACHLVVCDEEAARKVLKAATLLCQRKHRILHTTIQTDFSSDNMCCDTEAHQKDLREAAPRAAAATATAAPTAAASVLAGLSVFYRRHESADAAAAVAAAATRRRRVKDREAACCCRFQKQSLPCAWTARDYPSSRLLLLHSLLLLPLLGAAPRACSELSGGASAVWLLVQQWVARARGVPRDRFQWEVIGFSNKKCSCSSSTGAGVTAKDMRGGPPWAGSGGSPCSEWGPKGAPLGGARVVKDLPSCEYLCSKPLYH
ncbi:hypothetical protein Esti_002546 [Eimeria stiedai]